MAVTTEGPTMMVGALNRFFEVARQWEFSEKMAEAQYNLLD